MEVQIQAAHTEQVEVRAWPADIFNSIFSTGPAVALMITLFLDNTIPGSREERGLHVWQQLGGDGTDWWEDDHMHRVSRGLLACYLRARPLSAAIVLC